MGEMTSRSYAPNRIKELRKAARLSQEQLAAKMPSDPAIGTISKLEQGKMGLTVDWQLEIAAALGVKPDELVFERHNPWREIPVVGSIAAGNWREAIEDPEGVMLVPLDAGGPNTIGLRVVGDSMDVLAPDGAFVAMDTDDRELHDRHIYAVLNEQGESTFKRFFTSPARLEPCSRNPEHKPITLGAEPFTVLGRITYMGMSL